MLPLLLHLSAGILACQMQAHTQSDNASDVFSLCTCAAPTAMAAHLQGTLHLQLSTSPAFDPSDIVLTDAIDVGITSECSARVPFDGLAADTSYHYRIAVEKPSCGLLGMEGGAFATGTFRTLPAEGATAAAMCTSLVGFSACALSGGAGGSDSGGGNNCMAGNNGGTFSGGGNGDNAYDDAGDGFSNGDAAGLSSGGSSSTSGSSDVFEAMLRSQASVCLLMGDLVVPTATGQEQQAAAVQARSASSDGRDERVKR